MSGIRSCDITAAMETICSESLALAPDETLLLVADPPMEALAGEMREAARSGGYRCELALVGPVRRAGKPPPEFTRKLMDRDKFGAALLVTSRSLSHTDTRRWACYEAGLRIASMPGLTRDMLVRLFRRGAIRKLAEPLESMADSLEGVSKLRIGSSRDTDISFSIAGRKIYHDNGLYDNPGRFGNLPAGEICLAPVEGSVSGVLLVDVAFAGIGRVNDLRLEIEGSRITAAMGEGSRRLLGLLSMPADRIVGEFGIGVNPLARPGPVTLEAEKAMGTVHFGFGDNRSFGGSNTASGHWDAVLLCDEITADGRRISLLG